MAEENFQLKSTGALKRNRIQDFEDSQYSNILHSWKIFSIKEMTLEWHRMKEILNVPE